jgi:hypothetical protein
MTSLRGSNTELPSSVTVMHINSCLRVKESHAAPGTGTVEIFAADQPTRSWRCVSFA